MPRQLTLGAMLKMGYNDVKKQGIAIKEKIMHCKSATWIDICYVQLPKNYTVMHKADPSWILHANAK